MHETDDEIGSFLARLNEGNDSAFEELYRRYIEKLMRLAERQMGKARGPAGPDDVAISVFGSVIRGIHDQRFRFESDRRLWNLLVTIALNKIRKRARRKAATRFDDWDAILASDPAPEDLATYKDLVERVLDGLDASYRNALEMRCEGSSIREIAETLGSTQAAVKYRLKRIRERLRRFLDQGQFDAAESDGGGSSLTS